MSQHEPAASATQDHNFHERVRPWTSSDDPRFPLRTPAIDPWRTCFDKSKAYDKGRIELWKDEVDKILLFAALFSAIVRAFTLESSKLLQIDHQESAAAVLYAMHQQLDSIARQNITTLPSLLPDPVSNFRVPSHIIAVSALWFLSLLLSLTTATLGIFCLQWLREHRKEPSGSAKEVFPLLVLRIHRIGQWGVPTVIESLPMLLLLALVLFLGGLGILLARFVRPLGALVSCSILAILLVFIILTVLPILVPSCAYRTPQSRVVHAVLTELSARPTSDTALEQAWCRPGEHPSGPVSPATRRFTAFDEWTPIDQRTVKRSRDFGFQWFAEAFAHDRDAVQAFVECVEAQIYESQTKGTAEENEQDIKVRIEEMMSLKAGQPQRFGNYAALAQMPSGLAYDVAMAYCIDYAAQAHPSLVPVLITRRSELQLRIFNASSSMPLTLWSQVASLISPVLDNFAIGNDEHLTGAVFPDGFHDQICETIWVGFRTRTHLFEKCLHLLLTLRPEPNHDVCGEAVAALNQRLQQALSSSPSAEMEWSIRMLVAYVCKWLSCHLLTPLNRADSSKWPTGPTASFTCLARAVLAEADNHPNLLEAMKQDLGVLRKWVPEESEPDAVVGSN